MTVIDSRRLTGPNLVWGAPGALLDVQFEDNDSGVVDLWKEEMRSFQTALGWDEAAAGVHVRRDGAWLVAPGRIDQLYTVIEASETAWKRAVVRQQGGLPPPVEIVMESLRALAADEANPGLTALQQRAALEGVSFLWDDDKVSVGLGRGSHVWPANAPPSPDDLDWARFSDIPVAVITGTNGKSTNVRLLSQMVSSSRKIAGNSSTDWIRVGDEILDRGDYSGPGGARAVLRDPRVDFGILEMARGGLLRRGAGVNRADVALITNVAEDHMGHYGIHTLDDLIEAKMIVSRLVADTGVLVLNADDEGLVRYSDSLTDIRICWFSLDPDNELVRRQMESGGSACFLDRNVVIFQDHETRANICRVEDIPVTLGGRARYNVANCLSSTAVAMELGIGSDAVRDGLLSFKSDPETNPGRGNYFEIDGVTVLLDFAHNSHALRAILEATAALKPRRRLLTLGTAGDRTEKEIRDLARSSAQVGVERILVTDCVGYERELGPGGVPRILYDELMQCGAHPEQVTVYENEMDGVRAAFDWAEHGDLIILLVLSQREEVLSFILSKTVQN